MKTKEKIEQLLKILEDTCKEVREDTGEIYVCGLCEYDADHGLDGHANECPGFDSDDCFRLKEELKDKYLEDTDWGSEEEVAYHTGYSEGFTAGEDSRSRDMFTLSRLVLDYGTNREKSFSVDKEHVAICPCCGSPMGYRYMEDRVFMFRCDFCKIVTLLKGKSPGMAADKLSGEKTGV